MADDELTPDDGLTTVLTAADPVVRGVVDVSAERLARIHGVLESRIEAESAASVLQRARSTRRWVGLAAAAAVAALVGTAVLSTLPPERGGSLATPSVAMDGSGYLRCVDSRGASVAPAPSPDRTAATACARSPSD